LDAWGWLLAACLMTNEIIALHSNDSKCSATRNVENFRQNAPCPNADAVGGTIAGAG
jgi:hypothetical protein